MDWEHFEEPWKSRWTNSKTDFHSIENRNRLQQEKLIFSCDGFSRRAHLAIESNGCVLLCKIVCHVAITWNFPLYPFFLAIVVRSVTTEVVTLRDNSNDYFATHSGWLGYSRKTKWELVIRDKNFLDLNTWVITVDTRFVLLFLEFTKKDISECLRAKLWKFDSSPWKPLLKILAARWFLLSWAFAFKKTRAKRVHSCFWGFRGACPLNKITEWEFITVVKKYPLCILAYFFLNLWTFSRNLKKLPLD